MSSQKYVYTLGKELSSEEKNSTGSLSRIFTPQQGKMIEKCQKRYIKCYNSLTYIPSTHAY